MKPAIYISIFYLVSFVIFVQCKKDDPEPLPKTPCQKTNCADYNSMVSAQTDFDSDPTCHDDLDADNDGLACEEPGNSVTTCSNTSNCGCSGILKANCGGPCCVWVVGTGCVCK